MRKNRKTETADERQRRLDAETQRRAQAHESEEQTIDEAVRRSIHLFGA